jgi:hypothetical protein
MSFVVTDSTQIPPATPPPPLLQWVMDNPFLATFATLGILAKLEMIGQKPTRRKRYKNGRLRPRKIIRRY